MAKKRKIESESSQLPQEIEQQEEKIMAEEEEEEEEEEEFVEYEEEVVEEEEEEEEDPEELEGEEAEEFVEEEEEEEGKEKESDEEEEEEEKDEEEEEREPIESVISAFNKEALITLLSEAAERHPDVAARVRAMADVDPAQRKIFVHGLNWETTSEMLMEEFLKFGEIEECRLVANKAGRCKGYGFILFKTGRAARQALKEPQKVINNRITSCQLASVGPVAAPLEQQQQQQQQQQQPSEYTRRKIYVSNVGAELDPMKLKDFFSKYGEIEEGPLGLDKETGKPKGFCLFVYKTVESAKWALEEPHKQFEGVTLHCQKAIDGPKSQKTQIVHHMKPHTNQHFVDNVAPSVVGSTVMPAPAQAPPLWQQQQLVNVDPAALGQALTALMMAQGAGFNGSFGAVGASTGMLNHPAVVPGFGGQVVQGGYGNSVVGPGGGLNMGVDGMGGYGNQGGYPVRQKRRRGSGR